MNRFSRSVLFAVALATLSSSAQSGELYCNGGMVKHLGFHMPGTLYIQLSNMNTPVSICSMDTDWVVPGARVGPTTPAACKAMYASLMVVKQSGQAIPQMLFDSDQIPANCESFTAWAQMNVRWVLF
jgi:hypothetical protein